MKQYVIVLRPVDGPAADEEQWEVRPTDVKEVAAFIEKSLERGGPDVEVYHYFEQDG